MSIVVYSMLDIGYRRDGNIGCSGQLAEGDEQYSTVVDCAYEPVWGMIF
jgi:hypothetical protein